MHDYDLTLSFQLLSHVINFILQLRDVVFLLCQYLADDLRIARGQGISIRYSVRASLNMVLHLLVVVGILT